MAKFTRKSALRAFREKTGLTADECGAKVGVSGITWRSYENGNREVDADMALKIEGDVGIDRMLIRPDLFRRTTKACRFEDTCVHSPLRK